ncbi:MAG: preprotein translocase subunit SecE [Candidatus Moraniibacteriota bacterium]
MQKLFNFILEAKAELMKVNWPSREALIRYTVLVVVISLAVALFLGTLDSFFSYLVNRFLLSL